MAQPKIQIVTDSTAYLSREYLEANPHVHVIPLSVSCNGEIFEDDVANNERFIAAMNEMKLKDGVPSTSQPAPGIFATLFNSLVEKGHEIITITLSSNFSGTVQSARTAADMVGADTISVIDSKTTVAGLGMLVEDAAKAALEGRGREEIVAELEAKKSRIEVVLVPGTLEYLYRGGRIGNAQALLGSLLNITPVLYISDEGIADVVEKVRTKKKAIARMVEEMPANCTRASYGHVMDEKSGEDIRKQAEKKIGIKVSQIYVGPVIMTHTGPGVLGLIFELPEDKVD